jgi:pimeloyl-ACP methyl ester carboxylesterase
MGGAVAMQTAIRHPDKVRRAVIISSTFRRDGMLAETLEAFPNLTADAFKGSAIEAEYKKLSPTPDDFPNFVQRVLATALKGHELRSRQAQSHHNPCSSSTVTLTACGSRTSRRCFA